MKRGGKLLTSAAVLGVAACGGSSGKLEIRSTPSVLAQGEKPVPFRIAEARGQLALGNVALALEAFRRALREDPNSVDALAGMASCYDSMGRYDLSRRNYEAALALAPANLQLLGALAGSLEQQGLRDEALGIRREIASRRAAAVQPQRLASAAPAPQQAIASPPQAAAPPQSAPAPVTVALAKIEAPVVSAAAALRPAVADPAPAASVTVKLPPAREPDRLPVAPAPKPLEQAVKPAPAAEPVRVVQVPAPAPMPVVASKPQLAPLPAPAAAAMKPAERIRPSEPASPATTLAEVPPLPVIKQERPVSAAASSVTIKLPPARPATDPAPARTAAVAIPPSAAKSGPRLERLSMGEIALVSGSGPLWRSTAPVETARNSTVRFVPLRQASAQPLKVRLLNAARVNRLAARTRSWLVARGWQRMSIGNARAQRNSSVILYPAEQRALAKRLSAQFGFAMAMRPSAAQVTILLGRDAVRHPAFKARRG